MEIKVLLSIVIFMDECDVWVLFPLYSAKEVIPLLFYAHLDQKLTRNTHETTENRRTEYP